jgi:phage antirepressor YoqD-like protein
MSNFSTIDYGENTIRIMRSGESGGIGKICLNDLCSIIRKPELLRNGTAQKLCPSLTVETDGCAYVLLKEALDTLQSARKSLWGRQSVASLMHLVDALIEEERESLARTPDAPRFEESTMEYGGSPFRVRRGDGRTMFNATEICKAHNKAPFLWTKLNTTQKLMEYIVENGFADSVQSLVVSSMGRYGHTWIDYTLLIHLGRWISAEFGTWCEQVLIEEGLYYNEIATIVFESHRKTKLVRTQATLVNQRKPLKSHNIPKFALPETLEEAQTVYREQYALIEELLPKAEYYERQVECRDWFPNSFIANELGISIRQLNMFLEIQGVQERKNDKWVLCKEYRAMPLKTAVPYDNIWARNRSNMRSVWTPYGRDYVHEIWKVKNG